MEFTRNLKERDEELTIEFYRFIEELKTLNSGESTIILFGSRSEGPSSYLSDFDLFLLINSDIEESEIKSQASGLHIDLHPYTLSSIDEKLDIMDTVLLDAVLFGTVLYDGLGVIIDLRHKIQRRIDKFHLKRSRAGWLKS